MVNQRRTRLKTSIGRVKSLTEQSKSPLMRFFDLVDGVEDGTAMDILADDFEFEMVFPDTRVRGGKEDFRQNEINAGHIDAQTGNPIAPPPGPRHHVVRTLTVADGFELMVGEARGSRRSGTLVAAAQANSEGKLTRYVVVLSSVAFQV